MEQINRRHDHYIDVLDVLDSSIFKKKQWTCDLENDFKNVKPVFFDQIQNQTYFNDLNDKNKEKLNKLSFREKLDDDLQHNLLDNIFQAKKVYIEIHSCQYSWTAHEGIHNLFFHLGSWEKDYDIKRTMIYKANFEDYELHDGSVYKTVTMLLESDKPIYEELLCLFGAHVNRYEIYDKIEFAGLWIDIIPFFEHRFSIDQSNYYNWSYDRIEHHSSYDIPFSNSFLDIKMHAKDVEARCNCIDDLEFGFDICVSIIESKEFYEFLQKTPYFQKKLYSIKELAKVNMQRLPEFIACYHC